MSDSARTRETPYTTSCVFQLLQVQLFVLSFGVLGVSHWCAGLEAGYQT